MEATYDPGPLPDRCLKKAEVMTAPDVCQARRYRMSQGAKAWPQCVGCKGVESELCLCGRPKMRSKNGRLLGSCGKCLRDRAAEKHPKAARNAAIWSEFDGGNHEALARRHNLSVRQIYEILKTQQSLARES